MTFVAALIFSVASRSTFASHVTAGVETVRCGPRPAKIALSVNSVTDYLQIVLDKTLLPP